MSNNNVDSFNEGKELAKVIRSMIQHEDKLRNERVNWALVAQGFLIGITGNLWKTDDNEIIIIMIALVAFFLLISFWITVKENDKAINKLVDIWRDKLVEPGVKDIPITGCRLEKDVSYNRKKDLKKSIKDRFLIWIKNTFLIWNKDRLLIWNFLPLILIIFWINILLLSIIQIL